MLLSGFTCAQRLLIVAVGGSLLLDGLLFSALAPLLPFYAERHSLSEAHVGLLVASDAIGSLLAVPLAAWTVGRCGPRRTMLGGLLAVGAGALAFGLADAAWLLDVTRGATGGLCAFTWAAGFTWLAYGVAPHLRARAIGLVMGAGGAGPLLGPMLGTAGVYAGTLVAFGLIAALYVALAATAVRLPALRHRPATSPAALRERVRRQSGAAWAGLAWVVTLPALVSAVLLVQIPVRLDGLGFSAAAIGLVFVAAAVLNMLLSPLVGWWADRRGRWIPLRTGTLVVAVGAVLLPVVDQPALVVALTIATGVGTMLQMGPTLAMLADRCEALQLPYEIAFSGQTMGWAVGYLTGALGAGVIAGATSPGVPLALVAVLGLATAAVLARLARSVEPCAGVERDAVRDG